MSIDDVEKRLERLHARFARRRRVLADNPHARAMRAWRAREKARREKQKKMREAIHERG